MKRNFIAFAACLALALPAASGALELGPVGSQESQKDQLKIDLNRAGVNELVELPGIGEKVAERIIAYREENGPFEETAELMNVRGIGEKTYLKLEPHLIVTKEKRKEK